MIGEGCVKDNISMSYDRWLFEYAKFDGESRHFKGMLWWYYIEDERELSIIYPKCRQKDPLKEWPLKNVEICSLCEQDHPMKLFPLLLGLKTMLKGTHRDWEILFRHS